MVEYDINNLPKVSQEERDKVAAMTDGEIDLSDASEITDFSPFVRWQDRQTLNRRHRVELELDDEVLVWIGDNYKTQINAILREAMKRSGRNARG
jgi:uncharacterized protein (DUF4415 family)